jgi:hypothetical protein
MHVAVRYAPGDLLVEDRPESTILAPTTKPWTPGKRSRSSFALNRCSQEEQERLKPMSTADFPCAVARSLGGPGCS